MTESKQSDVEAERDVKTKRGRVNIWMISTIILAALLLTFLLFNGKLTGFATAGISKDDAGKKVADFFSSYYQTEFQAINTTEVSGVYKIYLESSDGTSGNIYLTKDGKYLGSMNLIPSSEEVSQQQAQPTEIPKSDKPVVELYVMSFCPYGVQAENAMKPVYDLLKNSADVKIRFIAQVGGTTVESVQSLHGLNEAKEDLRQVCIAKAYPNLYWNYVAEFDAQCYPKASDAAALETCWKAAATKFDISTAQIEKCAYGIEGLDLLKADESLTDKYGVSGSPTIMINGATYNGGRTADAYKTAICDAFNNAPAECSQTLSTTATAASGNCG